jgi:hypothetical protein
VQKLSDRTAEFSDTWGAKNFRENAILSGAELIYASLANKNDNLYEALNRPETMKERMRKR